MAIGLGEMAPSLMSYECRCRRNVVESGVLHKGQGRDGPNSTCVCRCGEGKRKEKGEVDGDPRSAGSFTCQPRFGQEWSGAWTGERLKLRLSEQRKPDKRRKTTWCQKMQDG